MTSLLCNSAKVVEKLLHRHSEPKAKNPKKTETVIIGRGCEPIISAESLLLSLSGASSEPIISAESKRNQAMSLRGRAVGSDVVIFHAETGKALSLSGASSEPIISAESLYCHARPRSGISAESKRDPRLIATQSPRMTEKALSFLRLRGASGAQRIPTPVPCREAHKRCFLT